MISMFITNYIVLYANVYKGAINLKSRKVNISINDTTIYAHKHTNVQHHPSVNV